MHYTLQHEQKKKKKDDARGEWGNGAVSACHRIGHETSARGRCPRPIDERVYEGKLTNARTKPLLPVSPKIKKIAKEENIGKYILELYIKDARSGAVG